MAKKIIILDRYKDGDIAVRACFWLSVPSTQQAYYADSSKVSEYKGATAAEIDDIKTGKVIERVESIAISGDGITVANVKANLIARFQKLQNDLTSDTTLQNYGTSWDGTTWAAGGL